MKRYAVLLGLTMLATAAVAADNAGKASYTREALQAQGITTVAAVVEKFSAGADIKPSAAPGKRLFLVDGMRTDLTGAEADAKLAAGKSVEVMGGGDVVVVNVLTK